MQLMELALCVHPIYCTEREYTLMQHGVPLSQLSTSQLRRLLPRVGCGRRRQLRLHRPAVLPRDLRRRQRMQARQRRIPLVELRLVVRTCGRNSNTFAIGFVFKWIFYPRSRPTLAN
jgi:hypothetical protein